MKKKFYSILTLGLLIMSIPAIGQETVVVVEPDLEGESGALNAAVDSIDNLGELETTVFELRRDGHYLLDSKIKISNNLHIRAEEGDGLRPVLQATTTDKRHFQMEANLILEGLHLNQLAADTTMLFQSIILKAENLRVIVDDCILEYAGKGFIRCDVNSKIYVTNSIFYNGIESSDRSFPAIINALGDPQDTLLIENTTLFNCSGPVFERNRENPTNVLIFNHNTYYQSNYQFHGIDLGKTMQAEVTNNVFYNFGYGKRAGLHDALFSIDSVGDADNTRFFYLNNNNWYTESEISDILVENRASDTFRLRTDVFADLDLLDTVPENRPIILHFIENFQVDTTNIFSEALTFNNPPPANNDYWQFIVENDFTIDTLTPPDPYFIADPYGIDFQYDNTITRSGTAAEDGLPLGDMRWFPDIGTSNKPLSISDHISVYPNPSNGIFHIECDGDANTTLRMEIFNISGVKVYMREFNSTGYQRETIDLQHLDNGIYILRMQQNNWTDTRKLVIR